VSSHDLARFLVAECLLTLDDALLERALSLLARMSRHGFAPAPLIVADVIAATLGGELQVNSARRNDERDMLTWLRRWRRALERITRVDERLARAALLLETLMASAPVIDADAPRRARLEAVALLGDTAPIDGAEVAWVAWRRALEDRLGVGREWTFVAALVQLSASGAVGFGTCDEGLWHVDGETPLARPTRITAVSRQAQGEDHERFRDLRGPFETLSSYTMPPDPSRLVATELALVSSPERAARAMLAAKLADGSMAVRFGSVELPARRRARCLLIVTLSDAARHHHQARGQLAPEVDFLRAVLVQLVPACVLAFGEQSFDTALEIRRDGPVRGGSYRLPSVRTKSGAPLPMFATIEATLQELTEVMPWMLDDAPARALELAAPRTDTFDACFVVSLGEAPGWAEALAPAAHVALLSERPGVRRLAVMGASTRRAIVDVSPLSASDIARLAVERCGAALAERAAGASAGADAERWQGTILS